MLKYIGRNQIGSVSSENVVGYCHKRVITLLAGKRGENMGKDRLPSASMQDFGSSTFRSTGRE
jgi:hypothetical protein